MGQQSCNLANARFQNFCENLRMQGFPWQTYSYKGNKRHIHTLSVVIQSSMQLQQKETGTNIYTFNKAPV